MKQLLKNLFMKQRKSSKTICIILICCLYLASCRIQFSPTPTLKASRGAWLVKFLQNPTCQPPCWEHMVPGVTSIKEVREKLSERKDIQITAWDPDRNVIEWRFEERRDGGRAESWYDGELLRYLYLWIDQGDFTLSEFISSYGPPTNLDFYYDGSNQCTVLLTYLPKGMGLSFPLKCKRSYGILESERNLSVKISSDTRIDRIYLFQSGEEGYLKTWGPDSIGNLEIEWKGFGDYIK